MELLDFLRETQAEVRSQMNEGSPYAEMIFSDIVMQHMAEIGMTFEPVVCHHRGQYRNAILRLSGYALSDDQDQLDLFVSLYDGVDELTPVPDADTKTAVEQCLRFLSLCADGNMAQRLDPSSDVASLAGTLQAIYNGLEQIRGVEHSLDVFHDEDGRLDLLAALELQIDQGLSVPLIADDLFINFDDHRTAAGLRVLGDLSSSMQVVFLTHHDHLVPLAKEVLGADLNVVHL